jgi:hypothetical protein
MQGRGLFVRDVFEIGRDKDTIVGTAGTDVNTFLGATQSVTYCFRNYLRRRFRFSWGLREGRFQFSFGNMDWGVAWKMK